jgi:mono/diheme cytochrome c family protein
MIIDPQGTVPGTVMPKVPMTRQVLWETGRFDFQLGRDAQSRQMREEKTVAERMLELVSSYLLQREPSRPTPPEQLPLPAYDPQADSLDAKVLYGRYCVPCHGEEGRGDGPNAEFLPVEPASHADAEYMSGRPDDSLFDAISVGGYIMNRSPTMPPFGETLTREQIWSLVRYLRTLCDCQGPEWSRDNR